MNFQLIKAGKNKFIDADRNTACQGKNILMEWSNKSKK